MCVCVRARVHTRARAQKPQNENVHLHSKTIFLSTTIFRILIVRDDFLLLLHSYEVRMRNAFLAYRGLPREQSFHGPCRRKDSRLDRLSSPAHCASEAVKRLLPSQSVRQRLLEAAAARMELGGKQKGQKQASTQQLDTFIHTNTHLIPWAGCMATSCRRGSSLRSIAYCKYERGPCFEGEKYLAHINM